MADLRIIIMAYNEAENLPHVLDDVARELAEIPHEVLVVDDGSTDGTGDVAARYAARFPAVRVLRHPVNLGLGGVYRTGFAERGRGFVTFLPADGQYPAHNVRRLLALSANADLVLGVLSGRRETLLGHALSQGERLLYRLLLGPLPRFQGLFLLRAEWLDGVSFRSDGRGWAIVMELLHLAARRKTRLAHVELELRPRLSGRSKVQNGRTIAANLAQLFRLAWQLKSVRFGPR